MKQSGIMTTITEEITGIIANVMTGTMVMDMVGKNKEVGKINPLQKGPLSAGFFYLM